MIKLLGLLGLFGATAATAIAIDRKRRVLPPGPAKAPDLGYREYAIVDAEIVGIAEVDPSKLTQMGEGIDPELNRAAHEEIPEQRSKLPKR